MGAGAPLAGRVALVTGAARGIGAAIAAALAEDGASVAIGDIDAVAAVDTAARLAPAGERVVGLRLDITDAGGLAAAIEEVETALGPIDVLVNNAGVDV